MLRRSRLAATAFLLALSALVARAHADEEHDSAAELFRRGLEAAAHKDYAVAARAFESAQRKSPHPVTAFNAGLAWQAGGEKARAADDFALALSTGLADPQAADAKKRLATLEADLGRLAMRGPPGTAVVIDGAERPLPAHAYVTAGNVALEVRFADGRTATRTVVARANVETQVDLQADAPASRPATEPAPATEPPEARTGGWLGWALLGGGAALVAGGVVVGVVGAGARDDFVNGGSRDASQHDTAVSLRTWSNVLWIAGAVTGAVGAIVLVGPLFSKRKTAALEIGPTAITMRASF
jgi:hypothetical protein